MGLLKNLKISNSGYIFISHSHNDIKKVRIIRNELEQNGLEPLCFFLKCLDDDAEIADLIKREIDAREWFLYVNSENSRKSKWVNMERQYIESTNKKKIIEMDLNDEVAVKNTVDKILHNLRIFISYSTRYEEIAERINKALEEKDYATFFAKDDILVGANFSEMIQDAIEEAAKEGCVLMLIDNDAINSCWMKSEMFHANENRGNIVVVFLGDVTIPDSEFGVLLKKHYCLKLSSNPTDQEIYDLVEKLGAYIVSKK